MATLQLSSGTVHRIPTDLRDVLMQHSTLRSTWNDLTPLARNEWICWVTIVKKPETRLEHLARLQSDLLAGKRRPCCWPGCPHRRESARKWFKNL